MALAIGVAVLYGAFGAVGLCLAYSAGTLVPVSAVSIGDMPSRMLQDGIFQLSFPAALMAGLLLRKKSLRTLGLRLSAPRSTLILALAYAAQFLLFGEKTIAGVYLWVYYLVGVGFSEEVVFRGFVFQRLYEALGKSKRAFVLACVVSGSLFGATHAIMPAMIHGESFFLAALSDVGGGILFTALTAYLLKRTRSLYVPILLHALLDNMPRF